MNIAGRLYRITPVGSDRPNHYVDSHASLLAKIGIGGDTKAVEALGNLRVGRSVAIKGMTVECVA